MKFFSYSFGCRVNEAEKILIDQEMVKQGFVFDEYNPQIYIINTCAVTHKAEREARNLIYQIRKKLPQTKIVITGCSATYWIKNNLYQKLPVDLVIDNPNKEFIVEIIKKRLVYQPNSNLTGYFGIVGSKKNLINFSKFISSGRLLVKIQDGCQRFCSFCIVPYLRGLPKSVKIKTILDYIHQNENWISEVILTAINTEAFGYDTKESLIDLLNEIIQRTSIPRISFGSIHPWSITPQFLNFYKKILTENRLVNFFHIPIQSGSDFILNLMKRGYTIKEIEEKLTVIKKINPLAFLATDVIVGFLEENDQEFEKTYTFLEKSPFSRFHVFRFSKRKNTAAYYLSKRLKEPDEKTKKKRSRALRLLSQKKYLNFLYQNLNRKSTFLVLAKNNQNLMEGLLDNQLPALILEEKNLKPGEIINVKIEKLVKNTLLVTRD